MKVGVKQLFHRRAHCLDKLRIKRDEGTVEIILRYNSGFYGFLSLFLWVCEHTAIELLEQLAADLLKIRAQACELLHKSFTFVPVDTNLNIVLVALILYGGKPWNQLKFFLNQRDQTQL